MMQMLLNARAMPGVRRFIEYAQRRGYEPLCVPITPENMGMGMTTLVYTTDKPYFLVFRRRDEQRIPRRTVKELIGYEGRDLLIPYKLGAASVATEMAPGRMTPFVSKLRDFLVYLDGGSFENGDAIFPVDAGHAFGLPSCVVKELLTSLYGDEKVRIKDFW